MSEERPLNGALSDLAKPSQWVPLACLLVGGLSAVIAFSNKQATDEQNGADFKAQIVQTISSLQQQAASEVAELQDLQSKVQTLADNRANDTANEASQYQNVQAEIQKDEGKQDGVEADLSQIQSSMSTLSAQMQILLSKDWPSPPKPMP
jgi:type II secretory pathway pseudopilin PulG